LTLLFSHKKFDEDSKNVLKTVIFSLQVGLTSNIVLNCQVVLKSAKNQHLKSFLAIFDSKRVSE